MTDAVPTHHLHRSLRLTIHTSNARFATFRCQNLMRTFFPAFFPHFSNELPGLCVVIRTAVLAFINASAKGWSNKCDRAIFLSTFGPHLITTNWKVFSRNIIFMCSCIDVHFAKCTLMRGQKNIWSLAILRCNFSKPPGSWMNMLRKSL